MQQVGSPMSSHVVRRGLAFAHLCQRADKSSAVFIVADEFLESVDYDTLVSNREERIIAVPTDLVMNYASIVNHRESVISLG